MADLVMYDLLHFEADALIAAFSHEENKTTDMNTSGIQHPVCLMYDLMSDLLHFEVNALMAATSNERNQTSAMNTSDI
jgi:hypothetical protein